MEIMLAPTFLARLKLIHRETVDKSMCDELEKYVKQSSFNPVEVQKVSLGASILCEWVLALISDRTDTYASHRSPLSTGQKFY